MGNGGKILGAGYIDNTDRDKNASYYGVMTNNTGLNIYGDLIFQPMIFEDGDFYENRTSALLLGLMRNRKRIGIYCDGNDFISINKNRKTISAEGRLPLILVDAINTSILDSSHYITRNSITRQTVGMDNLRYTISNIVKEYSIDRNELTDIAEFEDKPNIEDGFTLSQNYPNPFNPTTTIRYEIPSVHPTYVKLCVYDILGHEIKILVNQYQNPGFHEIEFNAGNLPSGVYFYRISSGKFVEVKRMLLLK